MTKHHNSVETDIFLETHILRMRIVAFVIGFAAATFFMVSAAKAESEQPPLLREQISVTGKVVTLGDLFENAGEAFDRPVFRSPDLGFEGTISAVRVQKAAARHGLAWPNLEGVDAISVRRRAREISVEDQQSLVRRTLAQHTKTKNADMLDVNYSEEVSPYYVSPNLKSAVVVKSVAHNSKGGSFKIVLGLEGGDNGSHDKVLRGRAFRTALVHVPRKQIPAGTTINGDDLKEIRIPIVKLNKGLARDLEQIVGKSSKRPLKADAPIQLSLLGEPQLVRKNSLVDIAYERGGLSLKAEGRALTSGALGDTVKVVNTHSRKTVEATVTGSSRVSVSRPDYAPRKRRASFDRVAATQPATPPSSVTKNGWEAVYRVR